VRTLSVAFRTVGGQVATLAIVGASLAAIILNTAVAASVLVIGSLIAVGIVLASAILQRSRRSAGFSTWQEEERQSSVIAGPAMTRGASPYSSLSTYLEHRHASYVVLTFEQIESLVGFSLPPAASTDREWWTGASGETDGHTDGWTAAARTATPNLLARTVAFDRST
jgi:hypothetical protein